MRGCFGPIKIAIDAEDAGAFASQMLGGCSADAARCTHHRNVVGRDWEMSHSCCSFIADPLPANIVRTRFGKISQYIDHCALNDL
jgi:hypothetical protein